jgi:hexosaminidase
MKTCLFILAAMLMGLLSGCKTSPIQDDISLIPIPVSVNPSGGSFEIDRKTTIVYAEDDIVNIADYASEHLGFFLGFAPSHASDHANAMDNNVIRLSLLPEYDKTLDEEGYKVAIHDDGIMISANKSAGLFYGIQTVYQLLSTSSDGRLPALEIVDYPRFKYRGLHLDVSRHFMPIDFIYNYIDYMAMHKLNVFHWHLIDDQGWRLEIKKYPKLTEVGAWRVDMPDIHWNERPLANDPDNATYGGYYTQEEIRAVVEYAAARNISVMPEIEMPAHVMSALAAYPELSCTGENLGVPPGGVWPITHIYCAGNEATFKFLEDVLLETMKLFPFEYIHIGGDEAHKTNWEQCPKCQKRIKDEGLADEKELQSYFIQRIERFLNEHGRRLIGWDEILEGGLAPNATVMSWRGEQGGIEAAQMGHDVVMTPGSHCYFDHYQGDPSVEPPAIGGYTRLSKVYAYEPVPDVLNAEEAEHILGAQANVWTEYMPVPEHVEYMIFPRLAALSEVLWSPKEHRNWGDFSQRMTAQYQRYADLGINFSNSASQVTAAPEADHDNQRLLVTLNTEAFEADIRYTLDGSLPSIKSPKYKSPVAITESSRLHAAVFHDGKSMEQTLTRDYHIHKAFLANIELKYPNSTRYDGHGKFSLVNGILGTGNHADGNWKGFHEDDMVAVIDLGQPDHIAGIEMEALQSYGSWIFLPKQVSFEVSPDGQDYQLLDVVKSNIAPVERGRIIHHFATGKAAEDVRFVRVHAENIGVCPPGHSGEGRPAWLFVSEIIVK